MFAEPDRVAAGDGFSVDVHTDGRATTLTPRGELDLASAPELEAELERALRSEAQLVIVDLRSLEFIDSTGLRVIITAQQRAEASGHRFGVIDGGAQVHKLLALSGVLDKLNLL